MRLRALIAEAKDTATAATVTAVIRELLNRHFKEHDLPIPKVKLSNLSRSDYLAMCRWRAGEDNTTMVVQKAAMGDPDTLRRVLAHELIHHWQSLRTDQTRNIELARMKLRGEGHGPDFMQYAARINAIEGPDYVTKTSDQSYDTSRVPPFYIIIQPHEGTELGYNVASRPSKQQKTIMQDWIVRRQARLFRITDGDLWQGALPVKRFGGYGVPRDPGIAAALRKLYDSGNMVPIP